MPGNGVLQLHLTLDFGAYLDSLQGAPLFFDNACTDAISTSHRRSFISSSGVRSNRLAHLWPRPGQHPLLSTEASQFIERIETNARVDFSHDAEHAPGREATANSRRQRRRTQSARIGSDAHYGWWRHVHAHALQPRGGSRT